MFSERALSLIEPLESIQEMDAHTLSSLEFYEILNVLKGFASSELGRKECERIRPLPDPQQAEGRLREVTELREILEGGADLSLQGVEDIEPILQRTRLDGAILGPQELLKVAASIKASHTLKRLLQQVEERLASLKAIGEEFFAPAQLAKEVDEAIGPGGEIYDEASPHLKEIRGRVRHVRGTIQVRLEHLLRRKELKGAFQDEVITHRNNRFVILIRADSKVRVKGIVHDYSHSRMSLYLEPMDVVDLNNELNVLLREEEEEEEKVLRRLTTLIGDQREGLLGDLALQSRVDAIYAKARFSIYLRGVQPSLNTEGRVRLMAARHPLLVHAQHEEGEGEVVPIDLLLDPGQKVLVISGANTGGKTVALKTLGLLSLMIQAGLHIPAAADSEMNSFEKIFAYIGDEQDLQEHLSTFSSFILWLNRVLDRVDDTSLLLIDEIGVGTEHSQGAALAMGLLDYIRQNGGYAVVTSHFNPLKLYAYRHDDVANVAVQFDQETLKPTYRLLYGRPGTSQTFPVAERLGLTEEILDRARAYQEGGQGETEHLIGELERLHEDLQREEAEVARVKEETLRERERLRRAAADFQERRKRIVKRIDDEGRRIVRSLEARLKEVVKKVEERKEGVSELKGEFRRVIREDFMSRLPKRRRRGGGEEIKEGDQVEVVTLAKEGVVVELFQNPPQAEVSIGGMRVKAPLSELRFVSRGEEARQDEVRYQFALESMGGHSHGDLNVIGLRMDEALPKVDKFLDDALLRGWEQVRIIHGIGSGRLREAIQGHLTGHRWVKGFRGGELNEGGLGVTVVELR